MAIRRSGHWVSQLRVDVPDMRALESAVRNDFDEMVQAFITGDQLSFVLRGFEINMTGAVGNAANGLAVVVSDSAILHTTSMTSGSIFKVAPGAPVEILSSTVNSKVTGNFSPNSTNYVSIDFSRAPDSSTQAPRAIWDPTNKIETSKVLPIAQLMTYTFKITTTGFAAETLPMAIVQTDAANNVTSITDRRPMLFRLGQAGFQAPNPSYEYPWNNQPEGRTETPSTSSGGLNPFHGGDKQIKTLKEWMDAVMSILKEITGGIYWYSLGTGGSTTSVRQDGINTVITGRATVTHNLITPGQLNWNYGINNRVVGSRMTYVIQAYNAGTDMTLANGQVAYVNLVRDKQVVPNLIFTNGGTVVTSVGGISWTTDLVAGDYVKAEGTGVEGYYPIQSIDSISQVTLAVPYEGLSTGPSGTNAIYSFGVYQVVASPSTDRHVYIADREDVPITEDMYWMFFRDDNGGSVAKIYTRFKAGELEQGESQEVSDQVSLQLLQFIGALSESDDSPQYFSNNYITDGDSLVQAISDLDAAAGGSASSGRQDRSSKVIEGGTWSVNLAGTALTLSASAFLQLPGLANDRNEIAAQTITFPNAASVAYVEVNRADPGVAGVLTVSVADVDALVPTDNTVIIARRVSAGILVGQHSFLLKAGEYLELDGANAEIQRLLGQLRLRNHESTVSKVRIDAATKSLLNGHTLDQVIGNFLLDFSGAVINFQTGAVLKEDDSTALGNNFTPFSIPVGQYFWYGIGLLPGAITADNKQLATVLVTPGSSANASQALAPKPVVSGTIKLGAIQVQNIGGTITVVDVHRLGVGSGSGSGSGQGASFDAELRTYLKLSPYEFIEPNLFPTDEDDKLDVASTGSYSPATTYFEMTTGQTLITYNLLDPDFIAANRPLASARVILRYAAGKVDTAPVVEVSKNGGAYTPITMTRIGNTDTFDGEITSLGAAIGTSLTMRVTASMASSVYGYGVMYDSTFVSTPIGNSKYIHPVTFSGDLNQTAFPLPFLPDPKSLVVYDITRGQAYIYDPANTFSISGQTINFLADSFNFPGETIKLEFRQIVGNGFDNSDQNALTIAAVDARVADTEIETFNYAQNAEFRHWQRQNVAVLTSRQDDQYSADRWYVLTSGGATNVQGARVIDTPTATQTRYAGQFRQADATARQFGVAQILETDRVLSLRGKQVTFSIFVKAVAAQIPNLRASVVEWSGTANVVTSDIVATWASTPTLVANATYASTATDVAMTGNWIEYKITTTLSASFNNLILFLWTPAAAAVNAEFFVTQVQLVRGSKPRPWPSIQMEPSAEFREMQKYFEKSFRPEVAPGTTTTDGRVFWLAPVAIANSEVLWVPLKVSKFGVPTITMYNPVTGASGSFRNATTAQNYSGGGSADSNESFIANFGPGASLGAGAAAIFNWTAESEL